MIAITPGQMMDIALYVYCILVLLCVLEQIISLST